MFKANDIQLKKRKIIITCRCALLRKCCIGFRNLQKRAKKARYEREKLYMSHISEAGCSTGDYVGHGRGEDDLAADPPILSSVDELEVDRDLDNQSPLAEDVVECEAEHTKPLIIADDCESTGLSIYRDHITEVAAKVINCPIQLSNPSFSSLVRSGRSISVVGKLQNRILI